MKKTFIIIPTYNEKDNIGPLISEILALPAEGLFPVVVDDQSPDGTAEAVRRMMDAHPEIHLIVRQGKRGRGLAGSEGFRYALAHGADYIMEMDADFSHHPRYIPEFIENMEHSDIVIGSRFLEGALNSRGGLVRNAITAMARAYINVLLGFRITDPTSGYRCFKNKVLSAIDLENTVSEGPSILQELLFKASCLGYRAAEIPIVFEDRRHGTSTFGVKLMLRSLVMVAFFRYRFSGFGKKSRPSA